MWITSSLTTAITPTAIALGNFDGVHLGHQAVIRQILSAPGLPAPAEPFLSLASGESSNPIISSDIPLDLSQPVSIQGFSQRLGLSPEQANSTASRADQARASLAKPVPTVMTFFPHPQEFFSSQARPLLTPLPEKAAQINRLGLGQLVLLPFNQALANLSPEAFVETLLIKQLRAQQISVGRDFCFGKNRQGTVEDLKALAQRHGVQVHIAPFVNFGTERISSSRIRAALTQADLATAEQLLGRPYSLSGRVVQGQQLGRLLGFPTANLTVPPDKFLPRYGVYSVWVQGATATPGQAWPGVMNLGLRPTVDGAKPTIEVHLLRWSGDLYGKTLQVFLHGYLRPEQKFDGLDDLKAQIQQDCQTALALLTKAPVGNLH
ncbi:MAG: bifunctional riboflavin kinase/FAD synthetase [Leptolyngbyaceae cyanobacterium SM2_5_2]|nr:bifunctional riboflavin kinase/FAD synthetase [Leptolyngbyaceae cyanobacterium SM2_5_2]